MKCPKCGYHSFDHLNSCKKCNTDLLEHKAKFNLRGFFFSGQAAVTAPEPVVDEVNEEADEDSDDTVDFGFDFLDEQDQAGGKPAGTSFASDQGISIDQPFGADSETIPADRLDFDDDDDKPGKGPEFAF